MEEWLETRSEPLGDSIQHRSLLSQSLLFAEISKLSYGSPSQFWSATRELGFTHYQYLDRDGAQAYLLHGPRDCVVVCRGTEPHEWNDIKADANAFSVLAETVGRVHRGFKQEVDDLWPRLERALKRNLKPLWFTGHSLGGAMATICAGRCKLAEIPSSPAALYTFGSPRVGSSRYINFVQIPHYRWVNNNDIVCQVPPRWLGYAHCGQELYLNAVGKLEQYARWRRFRDRWYGFFTSLRKGQIDHFADHSMNRYIEYIRHALADEIAGRTRTAASGPASRAA